MANKQPEKQEDSLNQKEITVSSGKAKDQKRHEEGPGFNYELSFNRSFGSNLADAVEKFGEEVVFTTFHAQAVIKCQAAVRSAMERTTESGSFESNDAKCIEIGMDFVPGVSRRKSGTGAQSKLNQITKMLANGASREDVEAFLNS